MKIALLTYSSKPRGGVVHTLALAEALARASQDVSVWSLGRGGDSEFFRKVDPAVTVRMVPLEKSSIVPPVRPLAAARLRAGSA